MTEALFITLAGMLALPAAAMAAASLAVALVAFGEFVSLMVFLLLVTGGRKAGRP